MIKEHEVLEQIINSIVEIRNPNAPFIIGINGVDTSGKTVFSKKLEKKLRSLNYKVQIIHVDDFHNPIPIRFSGKNPIDDYYNFSFDFKKLITDILDPIRTTGYLSQTFNHLDLASDKFEKVVEYDVSSESIVLLEGVFILKDEIRKYLDYSIFIAISFEEMKRRAIVRDVPALGNKENVMSDYERKYIPTQKMYLESFPPKIFADIILNNEDWNFPTFEQ